MLHVDDKIVTLLGVCAHLSYIIGRLLHDLASQCLNRNGDKVIEYQGTLLTNRSLYASATTQLVQKA